MPTFLTDPSAYLYTVLILAFGVPLLAAFLFAGSQGSRDPKTKGTSRRRGFLMASGVGLLMLITLLAIDLTHESDREQINRNLKEMSQGVHDRNMDAVFRHVSDEFRIGGYDKNQLRQRADGATRNGEVDDIVIWDLSKVDVPKDATKVPIEFMFKIKGAMGGGAFFRCKAQFVKEKDGQWRLSSFEVFNPAADSNTPIPIPGR